jgi:hypothetical protein
MCGLVRSPDRHGELENGDLGDDVRDLLHSPDRDGGDLEDGDEFDRRIRPCAERGRRGGSDQ